MRCRRRADDEAERELKPSPLVSSAASSTPSLAASPQRSGGLAARLASLSRPRLRSFLLDKLWPAYFFCLILLAKANGVREAAVQHWAAGSDTVHFSLWLGQQLLTLAFLGLVVMLFLIRTPVVGQRSGSIGALVALGGTFVMSLAGFLPSGAAPDWLLATSAGLVVGGLLLAGLSLVWLGRCFGLFPEARGLVTDGPYRWVRHPVYLGEIISSTGVVLPSSSPWGFVLLLVTILLQYWRAVNEERALADAFPDYEPYRARTWRLVPWVH